MPLRLFGYFRRVKETSETGATIVTHKRLGIVGILTFAVIEATILIIDWTISVEKYVDTYIRSASATSNARTRAIHFVSIYHSACKSFNYYLCALYILKLNPNFLCVHCFVEELRQQNYKVY